MSTQIILIGIGTVFVVFSATLAAVAFLDRN